MRNSVCISTFCLLIMLLIPINPALGEETQQAMVDLDGDGILEEVFMEFAGDRGNFQLWIDGAEFEGWLDPQLTGFEIIDLDTLDDILEILIQTAGPSDDYEYLIYGFRDGQIAEVGHVFGHIRFNGDGTVLANPWMGFWTRTDKYILNPTTHELEVVPQELYSVSLPCTVIESFPIYCERDGTQVLEDLEVGSTVNIIACYDTPPEETESGLEDLFYSDWYLIRSSNGLLGWAQLDSFSDSVEGLSWAD